MGNYLNRSTESSTLTDYTDTFTNISDDKIIEIRTTYKIIDVDWIDKPLVKHKIFGDEYFKFCPNKKFVLDNMLEYYLNHKDSSIYKKKTDYLCNEKERMCICNTNADNFRKIYEGINYTKDIKYISWIREKNKPY